MQQEKCSLLSTQADVDELRQEILKIKELSEASSASSDCVRLGLITFTKLENSRLDKLHQAIAEQQREIYARIRTLTDNTYYEYTAIAFLSQEIAKYIDVQQNVQQIEEGIEALLQGQLSPKLFHVIATSRYKFAIVTIILRLGKHVSQYKISDCTARLSRASCNALENL
jgi:alpha-acetolactate decarboxylase